MITEFSVFFSKLDWCERNYFHDNSIVTTTTEASYFLLLVFGVNSVNSRWFHVKYDLRWTWRSNGYWNQLNVWDCAFPSSIIFMTAVFGLKMSFVEKFVYSTNFWRSKGRIMEAENSEENCSCSFFLAIDAISIWKLFLE